MDCMELTSLSDGMRGVLISCNLRKERIAFFSLPS